MEGEGTFRGEECRVSFASAWVLGGFADTWCSFKDVLMNAGADDLDDFTKILLCAVLGREKVAQWFVDRGGSLE